MLFSKLQPLIRFSQGPFRNNLYWLLEGDRNAWVKSLSPAANATNGGCLRTCCLRTLQGGKGGRCCQTCLQTPNQHSLEGPQYALFHSAPTPFLPYCQLTKANIASASCCCMQHVPAVSAGDLKAHGYGCFRNGVHNHCHKALPV